MEEENIDWDEWVNENIDKSKKGRPRKFDSGINNSYEHKKLYNKKYRELEINKNRHRIVRKQWRAKNPDKVKAQNERDKKYKKITKAHIKAKYNISVDEFNIMLDIQNKKCAICNKDSVKLGIDHCHITGNIRGLLCKKCNFGIGLFFRQCRYFK